ncbi:MAG: hypothetical protein HYX60_03925 [Legionella longbeachae]|nr:hypothetical protein [Legionella longbeachae]
MKIAFFLDSGCTTQKKIDENITKINEINLKKKKSSYFIEPENCVSIEKAKELLSDIDIQSTENLSVSQEEPFSLNNLTRIDRLKMSHETFFQPKSDSQNISSSIENDLHLACTSLIIDENIKI